MPRNSPIVAVQGRNSIWSVATSQPQIDPAQLAEALARDVSSPDLDSRSRFTIEVGGSIALILAGYLNRGTEHIDLVDEILPQIRTEHELLEDLSKRYGLRVAHFQSHFLPDGWQSRRQHAGTFRGLNVFVLDAQDVWVSKLFSGRTKDRDDLRVLSSRLDKQMLVQRLRQFAGRLLAESQLKQNAADNWYIVYGEPLPKRRAGHAANSIARNWDS